MSTTAFVPATLPEEFVASGATSIPFAGLTVTSDEPVTSTQLFATELAVTFASDPTLTDAGKISDTTGGGTAVSPTEFLEVNTIGSVSGNTVLGRLQFTAPTLKNGQSIQDNLTIFTATSLTPGAPLDSNVAQLTIPLDVVTAPAITGGVATQPDNGASLDPFATMVIADPDFANTAMDTATITVTDPAGTPTDADGLLAGIGLSKTGVGTYSIPNPVTPGTLSTVLQNLKFTPTAAAAGKTTSFEVDATDTKANLTAKDTTTSVVTPGAPPTSNLLVTDTSTGLNLATAAPATPAVMPYPGPVVGPTSEYINITTDNLNITATSPNWFIHSGSGEDAIQVSSGTNVLDGGTGSNFLIGGTGTDTFYVDDRSPPASIWSTILKFHSGDNATVFGITQAGFTITPLDNQGAVGSTGLTFDMTAAGQPDARITLAGFSSADLADGKIAMSFGTTAATSTLPAANFMLLHAT